MLILCNVIAWKMPRISSGDEEQKSIRETIIKVILVHNKNEGRKSICHGIRCNARKNLLITARPLRNSINSRR